VKRRPTARPPEPGPPDDERAHALVLGEAVEAVRALALRLDAPAARALGPRLSSARSPLEVVLQVLEQPAVWSLASADPLAAARARGVRARKDLLEAEGGAVGPAALAEAAGVSRQTVDAWRRSGRVLALDRGKRGWAFPAWQAADGRVLPGLPEALAALDTSDAWGKLAFFLGPDARAGGERPLDLLRRGEAARVLELAEGFGEHGAA
jgi:hypothetical protein